MAAKLDITGMKFGRLIAIKQKGFDVSISRKHLKWDCVCDCGNIFNARLNALRTGAVRSCGCILKDGNNFKHGMSSSVEYQTFIRIKERCYNEKNQDYYLYGARGIKVCDRWLESFDNFYSDMGDRPQNYSIDRIDNNGNYDAMNCRWANVDTQARNKRNNRFYEFNGENMCIADWAKRLGITFSSLSQRLETWTLEKSLTTYK